MKNANQIITSLQFKPQYRRILQHRCITKLISALLPSIRNNIKYAFIKNSSLYFIISATLNKYDKDNIINTIKMILKSPMIAQSEKFFECLEFTIEDVVVYTDHKPKAEFKPYVSSSEKLRYEERANGSFEINIHNKKLRLLIHEIREIIKKKEK